MHVVAEFAWLASRRGEVESIYIDRPSHLPKLPHLRRLYTYILRNIKDTGCFPNGFRAYIKDAILLAYPNVGGCVDWCSIREEDPNEQATVKLACTIAERDKIEANILQNECWEISRDLRDELGFGWHGTFYINISALYSAMGINSGDECENVSSTESMTARGNCI